MAFGSFAKENMKNYGTLRSTVVKPTLNTLPPMNFD